MKSISPIVNSGDIFLTTDPEEGISKAIVWAEKKLSKDHQANYSHVAIVDVNEQLLDTLWTVRYSPLTAYKGKPYRIYRPLVEETYLINALAEARKSLGVRYPWQRLLLYFVGLADNIHWDRRVCSENVAKTLHEAFKQVRVFDFEKYHGMSPDNIDDICANSPFFSLIDEGKALMHG